MWVSGQFLLIFHFCTVGFFFPVEHESAVQSPEDIKLLQVFSVWENMRIMEPNFQDSGFSGTTEMISAAWTFCPKQLESLVPWGARQNGGTGHICTEAGVESSACWPFGQAWPAWPCSQLRPGRALPGAVLCLGSGQWGGVCRLLLTRAWPARLVLQALSSTSPCLHPRGVICDSCPPSFLHVGARLWSRFPGSSFGWRRSVQSFGSTGYYPHSIPGRWFISTLADLCVLT